MRSLVIALLTIVGACYSARLNSAYLPPGSAGSAGGAGLIHPPGHGGSGTIKLSGPASFGDLGGHGGLGALGGFGSGGGGGIYSGGGGLRGGQDIPIISYSNENIGEGNYQFSYETGNGITVQETGHQQGGAESVSGSFSYTGPDGVQYSIVYTADEHGFHPQGAHLPTPPPIPPEIQRGVELALAAEARGENQDGGYSSGGGGHGGGAYQGLNSYQTSSGGGYQY